MYEWRIQREVLFGVYIPKDLGDAFAELNSKIDPDSKNKFRDTPEEIAAKKLHFSLGRWMEVNWSFYEGSRFSHFLRSAGVSHPDDMAQFVIITYHRYLNKQPLEVKELVEKFQTQRKEALENKKHNGEVIFKEVRQVPKEDSTKH